MRRGLQDLSLAGLALVDSNRDAADAVDTPGSWPPTLPSTLRRLRLHACEITDPAGEIDSFSAWPCDAAAAPRECRLAVQLTRLTALTSLTVGSHWTLHVRWRRALAPCASRLEEVDIAVLASHARENVEEVATPFPALRSLRLGTRRGGGDCTPMATLEGLPALTRLRLTARCWADVSALLGTAPQTLRALREVALCVGDHDPRLYVIPPEPAEATLCARLDGAAALQSLSLHRLCEPETARRIGALVVTPQLTSLRLRFDLMMQPVDMGLLECMPRLQELHLTQSWHTHSVPPVVESLPRRAIGVLAGLSELRRVALHGISEHCGPGQARGLREHGAPAWRGVASRLGAEQRMPVRVCFLRVWAAAM